MTDKALDDVSKLAKSDLEKTLRKLNKLGATARREVKEKQKVLDKIYDLANDIKSKIFVMSMPDFDIMTPEEKIAWAIDVSQDGDLRYETSQKILNAYNLHHCGFWPETKQRQIQFYYNMNAPKQHAKQIEGLKMAFDVLKDNGLYNAKVWVFGIGLSDACSIERENGKFHLFFYGTQSKSRDTIEAIFDDIKILAKKNARENRD